MHTVRLVYKGESKLLKRDYLESLKLASKRKIKSISFPAISSGVYGYLKPDFEFCYQKLK